MIRGVIFDLGSTLMYFDGNWEDVIARGSAALAHNLREKGIRVNDRFGAEFIETRRVGRERSARTDVEYTATQALRETLAHQGYPNVSDEIIAQALEVFFAPEEAHCALYTDARATLEQLRVRGLRVGLISNATDDGFVQRNVQRLGLSELLTPTISSAAVPWRKPDPRIFKYVLTEWNLDAEQVVMVGDWPETDVLGAHRAGMRAILLDRNLPQPPHLDKEIPDAHLLEADATVCDLAAVLSAIENLN